MLLAVSRSKILLECSDLSGFSKGVYIIQIHLQRDEWEWFRQRLDGLDDRGGRMIARKSARGLAHYQTLRADECLPMPADGREFARPAGCQPAIQPVTNRRSLVGFNTRRVNFRS